MVCGPYFFYSCKSGKDDAVPQSKVRRKPFEILAHSSVAVEIQLPGPASPRRPRQCLEQNVLTFLRCVQTTNASKAQLAPATQGRPSRQSVAGDVDRIPDHFRIRKLTAYHFFAELAVSLRDEKTAL